MTYKSTDPVIFQHCLHTWMLWKLQNMTVPWWRRTGVYMRWKVFLNKSTDPQIIIILMLQSVLTQ